MLLVVWNLRLAPQDTFQPQAKGFAAPALKAPIRASRVQRLASTALYGTRAQKEVAALYQPLAPLGRLSSKPMVHSTCCVLVAQHVTCAQGVQSP